jgi:NADH:ubiquinone oxidoreductase subunit B-like Fe-S oxidoreductase
MKRLAKALLIAGYVFCRLKAAFRSQFDFFNRPTGVFIVGRCSSEYPS